jgi:tRNA (mo5U34)-methyltransferase
MDVSDSMTTSRLELPDEVEPELLRSLVMSRVWFHRIDLGHGVVTPGTDDSPSKLTLLDLPERLDGATVLDIGAYDGYFSFEAERRGAARVVAADHFLWHMPIAPYDGRGFDIAHWALGSRVEKRDIRVEDMTAEELGTFDYVLFLGVLYHAEDPMSYLRTVFSLTRRTAIVESHVDGNDYERPMMVFYPGDTLNNDATNFWGPNRECLVAMLREVGFARVEVRREVGFRCVVHAHREP